MDIEELKKILEDEMDPGCFFDNENENQRSPCWQIRYENGLRFLLDGKELIIFKIKNRPNETEMKELLNLFKMAKLKELEARIETYI